MEKLISKKKGRPRLGKVGYYRRVLPEKVAELDALLRGGNRFEIAVASKPVHPEVGVVVLDKAALQKEDDSKAQIKALLDDIQKLTEERDSWKSRHANAVNATQEQLGAYWKREATELRKQLAAANNYSQ